MALKEELEKSGNWLFRWRSYLPIVVLALFLANMSNFMYIGGSERYDHWWEAFCLSVSFLGLGIRAFAIGYAPSGTSGRNTREQIADVLNTKGPYSLVRNPLYLGNFFMYLGIALFIHSWSLTAIFVLSFWLYYERIIFAEEAFLRKKFGAQYLDWANRVPAIIPKLSGYEKPDLPFSFRNVLRREYNGFFAVIVVMFLFELLGDVIIYHQLSFEREWVIFTGAAFCIWLSLRHLKRRTRLLEAVGR